MTAYDEVAATLQHSDKLDPATRELLLEFLAAGAPVLQSLESAALRGLLGWLAGGPRGEPPAAVDHLTAGQVVALLELTQAQMDAVVEDRRAEAAAARAAVEQLGRTALSLLARCLLAAL